MSRETFTLRDIGTSVGSIIQYNDSILQAASLSLFEGEEFFIETVATDYDEVQVSWNSPIFVEESANPVPTETIIRWSLLGDPQTVDEGNALLINNVSSITHVPVNGESWQGKWLYYTLFLKYTTTNDPTNFYFEKVKSLSVLVPKNYESIEELWSRIPEYYRGEDANNNNDLYRFLSVIAWNMDYIRTLVDYVSLQKDPSVASAYALQQLTETLGTLITATELGPFRARNFINEIFNLRRSKGTPNGIIETLQSITGSVIEIDTVEEEIKVFPQRINWMRDPQVILGLFEEWYTVIAEDTETVSTEEPLFFDDAELLFDTDSLSFGLLQFGQVNFLAEDVVFTETIVGGEVTAYATIDFQGASLGFDVPRDVANINEPLNEDPSQPILRAKLYSNFTVPYKTTDTFFFSMKEPDPSYIQAVYMYRSNGSVAASTSIGTTFANNVTYYELDMSEAPADGDAFVSVTFAIPPLDSIRINGLSLENNFIGDFFDGDTNTGGWLLGDPKRSDYRWVGGRYLGVSVYSVDYWRTRKVLENIYKDTLPVRVANDYILVFDDLGLASIEEPVTIPFQIDTQF